ncbi:hypothetical protein HDU76_002381, partial [Blyttiomyces sp. JEL0837]
MGVIEDFSIDPSTGSSSFLHGFLGVTPSVTVSGIVNFKATRSVNITQLRLKFRGTSAVSLYVADGLKHQEKVLASRDLVLLEPPALTALGNSNITANGSATGSVSTVDLKKLKKSDRSVSLSSGTYSYPFEIVLPEEVATGLPPSMTTEFGHDGHASADEIQVAYKLTAELELAPGLFGSAKTEVVTED